MVKYIEFELLYTEDLNNIQALMCLWKKEKTETNYMSKSRPSMSKYQFHFKALLNLIYFVYKSLCSFTS